MEQEFNYEKMEDTAKNVLKYLKTKDIKCKLKQSRNIKAIKAVELHSVLDYSAIFEEIKLDATIQDLNLVEEKTISGRYKSKLATIKTSIPGYVQANETFFILNTYTETGTLTTKQTTPEKLGLVKKKYKNLIEFDKDVISGIDSLKCEVSIKKTLKGLYQDVSSGKGDSVKLSKNTATLMSLVKSQDKQEIGKNFGEVLSLRWYITNFPGWTQFGFSTVSNAPLVDYFVEYNKNIVNISAKFEKGAAPSIKAIVSGVDKAYPSPTQEEKKSLNVIKILGQGSGTTSNKILQVFKELNLPGYKELQKILGKTTFSLDDIQTKIKKITETTNSPNQRTEKFFQEFSSFYAAIGKDKLKPQEILTANKVFSPLSYNKYFSLCLSPMGYYLVAYINSNRIYQDILNNASRNLDVEQIYLSFTSNSIEIKKKLFSKSEYKFAYGSNLADSDNTGIKFEMIRK
jgi:hypothetical protein